MDIDPVIQARRSMPPPACSASRTISAGRPRRKTATSRASTQITNTLLRVLPTYTISEMRADRRAGHRQLLHDRARRKAGVQLNHGSLSPLGYSSSNMRAVYRSGVPDPVNTYNTPTYSDMKDREMAYYVQDRWRPFRRLTMNLGLRAETNYGWINAACQAQTPFVAARCYEGQKGFPDWKAVNPRFSIIYDLAGDGRTALKFAANRYITPVGEEHRRAGEPDCDRERYARLDGLRRRPDERVRPEQGLAAADQRAGTLFRVSVRRRQPVRGHQVAVVPGDLG